MNALLMTATVYPGETPVVTLRDPMIRLLHYITATMMWAKSGPFDAIVLCENSGKGGVLAKLSSLVEAGGRQFEFIGFDGNRGAWTNGKGYGEGCILAHALLKSRLLQSESSVWKVTGRLFVDNVADLFHEHLSDEIVISPGDTRFFKLSTRFFMDHMIDIHKQVNDRKGVSIEVAYDRALAPFREIGRVVPFRHERHYVGQEAGSGNWNHTFPTDIAREAVAWMGRMTI